MATEEPRTVIVERSRSGMTLVIGLMIVAIIAVAAYFLTEQDRRKDTAITTAAEQVGDAAKDVGDAAQRAVNDR